MTRALRQLYALLLALSAVALLGAFGCVVLGVLGRQFGWALRGLDAYAGYAIAAALFLALPATLQRGAHIRITLLLQRLPARARRGVEAVALALALALATALAWAAARLVWFSHLTNDVSQASDATPLWIPQLAMAVGCAALALGLADALVAHLRGRPFFDEAAGDGAAAE
jgi:TRAP-type C4-dicarboxylate transport system permease small subunit